MGAHWIFFRPDSWKKKTIYRGVLHKKGELGQFADLKGDSAKKRGRVFLSGVDTLMHTMQRVMDLLQILIKIFKIWKLFKFQAKWKKIADVSR